MLPSNQPTVITYLVGNYKNTLHHPNPHTVTFRNVTLPSPCNTIKRHPRTDMPPKRKAGHSKIAQKSPVNRLFSSWRSPHHAHAIKRPEGPKTRKERRVHFALRDTNEIDHHFRRLPQWETLEWRAATTESNKSNKSNSNIFENEVENKRNHLYILYNNINIYIII